MDKVIVEDQGLKNEASQGQRRCSVEIVRNLGTSEINAWLLRFGRMTNQLLLQALVGRFLFCVECPVEPWIIDSGALFHATTCKDTIINVKTRNFKKVHLTDAETLT